MNDKDQGRQNASARPEPHAHGEPANPGGHAHSHGGHGTPRGHEGHGDHGAHAGHDKHAGHDPEAFRRRFWVSLFLTLPILYLSPQLQAWLGFSAVKTPIADWVGPVLGTALYFYSGGPFLQGALAEFRARRPGMMALIALAITVAYVYSLAVSLGFPGKPFYWELATLIDVMLLGHWLEMKSIRQAKNALEALTRLLPARAHRVEDGKVEDVPVEALQSGDVGMVLPGEQVPVDGVILEGQTTVNEAFLTGESKPVPKGPGDEVVAGAINHDGVIRVRVTRVGEGTALFQIVRLVRQAEAARSRFQGLADRAAGLLFYIALAVSGTAFGTWLALGRPFDFALQVAVTTLVIACPHALGLAIPLVNVNATALAAKNGILIRNREAFERAHALRVVAFDKTGTLTEGRFVLKALAVAPGVEESEALALAAGLEQQSSHPLAEAVVEAARARGVPVARPEDVRAVPGQGVTGRIGGVTYFVGRPEWLAEFGLEPGPLAAALEFAEARGESVVVLFSEDRVLAVFALADRIRPSARRAVERLIALDVEPAMITGDAEVVAREVARALGIRRYYARVLPGDKGRIVRELKALGPVAFVGDGINDAPALVEADLGVAIGAGTNVAIESADVVLVENDPEDAVRLLLLARATYRKMRENLLWATGYNVVALPLAAGVLYPLGVVLSPAVGALFMSLSTVIVALNALSLRRLRLA